MKRRFCISLLIAIVLAGLPGFSAAQVAPTATPVRELQVEDGHFIALSPDGTMIAFAIQATALCVYDSDSFVEISCGSIEALASGIRFEDIVWSPDSTMLAFAENSFVTTNDGDLRVMNARTGDITNVTDDGVTGPIASVNAVLFIDIVPAWTPDSQFITFSRSSWENGEQTGNQIAQVAATGGDVEILATVSADEPGIFYFGSGWSPDGQSFFYTVTHVDLEDPENGIWVYDNATRETRQLTTRNDEGLGPPTLLQVSPAGNQLLIWYPMAYNRFKFDIPLLRLVDTATGELTIPPFPEITEPGLTLATFSPDGSALLEVIDTGDSQYQFWTIDLASGTQTMVLDGLESATMEFGLIPSWSANGTVGISHRIGGVYLTIISGIGTNALPTASPVASPDAALGVESAFPPDSTAIAMGMTPVYAAPDPSGVVVAVLDTNDPVHILAAPVENASGVWYPVVDPSTQIIGYVQASRLGTSSDE